MPKKILYQDIHGNLGNQMFQYSFSLVLLKERKVDKVLYRFESDKPNRLSIFINDMPLFDDYSFTKRQLFSKKIIDFLNRKFTRIKKMIFLGKMLESLCFVIGLFSGYYPEFVNYHHYLFFNKKNYLTGYFENLKYLSNYSEFLKGFFTPLCGVTNNIRDMVITASKTNSVCITIRRGDFLSNTYKSTFYVCDELYFYNAIKIIKKIVVNPCFFVFSDDIEWCKGNMTFPEGTIFEKGNNSLGEKITMMKSCKHFIISNSTFSWWCQYLSICGDKIVVAPKYWRVGEKTTKKISDKNWILI